MGTWESGITACVFFSGNLGVNDAILAQFKPA